MGRLRRTALGKNAAKAATPRPLVVTTSMVQHLRKRVADAQRSLPPDREPGRDMKARQEEFTRTGKTTIYEGGKSATIEKLEDGIRVRFYARKGVPMQVFRFTSGADAAEWFEKYFPKHARM